MQRRYRTVTDLLLHERSKAIGIMDDEMAQKLTSMGLLPGSMIEMIRPAPFGGAYFIKVDGKNFALRNEEAASILIEA
jgi:ferrous iron transport protein A